MLVNYPGGRFAGVAASGDNREQMMHKAFEYEVKFGKDGRPVERRWSVGPVFITTCATVLLALTGAKNPTPSRPGIRWNWPAFYAIAELVEFPDHPRCARAFGLGTYRRTPFFVAHPFV